MSSVERDAGDDDEQSSKRARGDTPATPSVANREETPLEPKPQNDTEEVKEVTQGVHDVALDTEASPEEAQAEVAPEAVPLPEENPGELDDLATTDTVDAEAEVADATPAVDKPSTAANDAASDVASSSGDVDSPPASPSKKVAHHAAETGKPSPDTKAVANAPSLEEAKEDDE